MIWRKRAHVGVWLMRVSASNKTHARHSACLTEGVWNTK